MGLSVYIYADIPDVSKTTMTLTDPSGELVWTVNPSKAEYAGVNYVGTSDITMPKGFNLPIGVWTVELIYKDGRTVKENIGVDYSDKDEFFNLNKESSSAVFDSKYNLTFVP